MADISRNQGIAGILAIAGVVAGLLAAIVQHSTPVVGHEEGGRRHDGTAVAYADRLAHGLPTACEGITGRDLYGNPIVPGHVYTSAECDTMLTTRLRGTVVHVFACIPPTSVQTGVAVTSLAFNIGTTNFCRSTVAREFRAGHPRLACDHFTDWRWAGHHPRRPALLGRRLRERTLCIAGL